jgi:hypothetical protein
VLPARPAGDAGLKPTQDEGDGLVEGSATRTSRPEPEVLDGGDALPDAVVDPPAGELVEQADVLDHPQR